MFIVGHYLYVEVSSARPGQQAILKSIAGSWCQVRFAYHMYGNDIGTLEVMSQTSTGSKTQLWSRSGDQGNQWLEVTVTIPKTTGKVTVLIVATHSTVGGIQGDIAIDDISLGNCTGGGPNATIRQPEQHPDGLCGFETTLCTWYNPMNSDVDWVRRQGSTPTDNTGPTSDHTLGTTEGRATLVLPRFLSVSVSVYPFAVCLCIPHHQSFPLSQSIPPYLHQPISPVPQSLHPSFKQSVTVFLQCKTSCFICCRTLHLH